jgi:HEPN domain-containing protein
MKRKADLVSGWLKKAASDMRAMEASIGAEAFDAACFHAQQAAEKALKAYLIGTETEFPYTHNLTKLVALCASFDASFSRLLGTVEPLTPFAVEMRYDAEFWPSEADARDAGRRAAEVVALVERTLESEDHPPVAGNP